MASKHERHAASRWEWGSQPGRADERRAAAADDPAPAPRGPARKDTRRWCKGKEGREHTPGLVFNSGWSRSGRCQWAPVWQRYLRDQVVGWCCCHREACTRCGKVLRETWELTPEECPLYPGIPEQRAAAEAKLAEHRAWRAAHPVRWVHRPVPDGPQHYRRPRKENS